MIKLTINNSMCFLEGLTESQFKALRNLMSYSISAQTSYFSGKFGRNKRYLMDKRGFFPTGLFYIAEEFLSQISHTICDKRVKPKSVPGMFEMKLDS